jgi:hypothetical protein
VITTARTTTPPVAQVVDQLQRVGVVGDAEVGPHLLALDVAGVDAEDDRPGRFSSAAAAS